MTAIMPTFGLCPFGPGEQRTPTDTVRGIVMSETNSFLGKTYWGSAEDGTVRAYKIVKATANLTKGYLLKYSTSAGRYGIDVTTTTDDTDPVAGCVDDTYHNGVDSGKWFRMVVYAEKIQLKLGTTSDARCTLAIGDVIVANSDNGMVWKQNGTAANAAVQNRAGFALEATTNATDNGNYFDCELNLLR